MSGGIRMYSPAWFRILVVIAQRLMPKIKADNPEDDQATLLAKALSAAYHEREAEKAARKAEADAKRPEEARLISQPSPPHSAE